ncbi:MAG TPA: CocE/NonD family hydrolase [Caulobacteraceae bacterium]|jgi:hypothetical protein|nr:CocE/NonD family hydrolase [Caulobacteraceae bacterium]
MTQSSEARSRAQAEDLPDVRIDFDVETPMRDGVILRSDIYRPAGPEPVPALLTRGPYDKRVSHRSHMGLDIRAATARGYAVVVQDVRGRFASDGEFIPTPTQQVEGPDGYDTIEWIASQPWCSGAVGMYGASYLSLTQLIAASERPPSLRAIVPEKTGYPARGALLLDSILIMWTAGQARDWLEKAMQRQAAGEKEAAILREVMMNPQAAVRHLPLNDMPLMNIGGLSTFQETITRLQTQGRPDIAAIDIPVLIVSGWYDMGTTDTAEIYATLLERAAGPGHEANIIFGPWDHGNSSYALGEVYFGPFASNQLAEIPGLYLDFYDRHLKGDTTKPAPGARYFLMGANEWRSTPTWPPAHHDTAMYLQSGGAANGSHGDGRLGPEPAPGGMPADRYRYDPHDPAPSFGGRYFDMGGSRAGPYDQRRVEERDDVLVYTSEVLDAPLEITGSVRLKVFVSCSTPDTDLVLKLCDVSPDGLSHNVVDEFFRCRWRDGFDKTRLFEPGEVYEFDIDMGPIAHLFQPGRRLRLQVTSSAFPHYDRNMNTGHPIGVDATGLVAEVSLFHDAERLSRLILPVVNP